MEREHLVRGDFPRAHGSEGFDVDSVGAHLAAVAAHVAALEARIAALEVEREKLRQQLEEARDHEEGPSGLPDPGSDPLENLPEAEVPGDAEVTARLYATKLAMEGKGRNTIVMQLAAEHDVSDPGALADDVIARLA